MRAPSSWLISLFPCVVAVFAQCASALQQSEELPSSHEASQFRTATDEARNGAPVAHDNRKRTPVAHETRKRAPAHENRKVAPVARGSGDNESPATRDRRALRDKLNSGLVGIVFGGMDDADFSEAVDLGAVIGSPDIKILSVAGNGAKETVTDLLFARGIDVGIVQTDVLADSSRNRHSPMSRSFCSTLRNCMTRRFTFWRGMPRWNDASSRCRRRLRSRTGSIRCSEPSQRRAISPSCGVKGVSRATGVRHRPSRKSRTSRPQL